MKINVTYIYPPIPCRDFGYQATMDGYEPGDPIGWGATEEAAIADLADQLEDAPCFFVESGNRDREMLQPRTINDRAPDPVAKPEKTMAPANANITRKVDD